MSLADDNSVLNFIRTIIQKETLYLRHYIGKVVDNSDPLTVGRVKVQLDELGYDSPALAIWAFPRGTHQAVIPAIGEWVEVWFINGESRRPVYIGGVAEIKGQTQPAYTGPTMQVLFQDPATGDSLAYDETAKALNVLVQGMVIGAGTEAYVKGSSFFTFMTNLMTWLGTHIHTGVTTGAGVSGIPNAAPLIPTMADFRSTIIKGA